MIEIIGSLDQLRELFPAIQEDCPIIPALEMEFILNKEKGGHIIIKVLEEN